jgi:hypothetical protein
MPVSRAATNSKVTYSYVAMLEKVDLLFTVISMRYRNDYPALSATTELLQVWCVFRKNKIWEGGGSTIKMITRESPVPPLREQHMVQCHHR